MKLHSRRYKCLFLVSLLRNPSSEVIAENQVQPANAKSNERIIAKNIK